MTAGPSFTRVRRALQPLWSALDAALLHDSRLLLCVSGGPDSRALLEAVARWSGRQTRTIEVASVDHGTRPAARLEADSIVDLAEARAFVGHVCAIRAVGVGEGALREARYRALAAVAQRRALNVLVLAHHTDDAAEGLMMSLAGTGGRGLAPPARGPLPVGGGPASLAIVRPFLMLDRETLRTALSALGIVDAVVDPERTSARARVRVSGSAGAFPGAARQALRAREDDDALGVAAQALVGSVAGRAVVRLGPPALLRRALEQALLGIAGNRDPRDSARALHVVARMMVTRQTGTVHVAGGVVHIDAAGARFTPATEAARDPKGAGKA